MPAQAPPAFAIINVVKSYIVVDAHITLMIACRMFHELCTANCQGCHRHDNARLHSSATCMCICTCICSAETNYMTLDVELAVTDIYEAIDGS